MYNLKSRVVIAGPTTGKTTFVAEAEEAGFVVVDTDDMIYQCAPAWFEKKYWQRRRSDPTVEDMGKIIFTFCGQWAHALLNSDASGRLLIFSNLWGQEFLKELGKFAPDAKAPVFLFRKNPERIVDLSKARGGSEIPLDTAEHWVRAAEKYAPAVSQKLILLEDDEYLGTTLKLPSADKFKGDFVQAWPIPAKHSPAKA